MSGSHVNAIMPYQKEGKRVTEDGTAKTKSGADEWGKIWTTNVWTTHGNLAFSEFHSQAHNVKGVNLMRRV